MEKEFINLLLRLVINLLMSVVIIGLLYRRYNNRRSFYFTYYVAGLVVFFLCYVLEKSDMQIGLAIGLFAIFGIIRYRTDPVPIKEMTYLFMIIGISVINSLYRFELSGHGLLLINLAFVLMTWIMEKIWTYRETSSTNITYDKIELLHINRREELIKDLHERTGLEIEDVEIGKVDFALGTAKLRLILH